MNTSRAFLLILLSSIVGETLAAAPSFDGYLITAEKPLFMLSVNEKKSSWISVGGTFEGYSIVGFDPEAESVVVEKSGARQTLSLKQSKVLAGVPPSDASLRNLKGLELGYALAKRGDKELIRLIGIYQEAIAARESGKEGAPVEFFKAKIERVAQERRDKK